MFCCIAVKNTPSFPFISICSFQNIDHNVSICRAMWAPHIRYLQQKSPIYNLIPSRTSGSPPIPFADPCRSSLPPLRRAPASPPQQLHPPPLNALCRLPSLAASHRDVGQRSR
jgi:hypothetical protein